NHTAYEKLRTKLLTAWSETNSYAVADQVAKACLFLPYSEADSKLIGHLADLPVRHGTEDVNGLPYFQNLKALSEYRQGDLSHAAEVWQKAVEPARHPV